MRKVSRVKLNEFSKNELDQRKLNALKGGCNCGAMCDCCWSIMINSKDQANFHYEMGYTSQYSY